MNLIKEEAVNRISEKACRQITGGTETYTTVIRHIHSPIYLEVYVCIRLPIWNEIDAIS